MKYAMIALLMLAVLASGQFWQGAAPRGKTDNNLLYTWDGIDYELQRGLVGYASYTTTTSATTDTVKVLLRTSGDHAEIWLRLSAQNRKAENAGIMYATVLYSPVMQRRAVTAADTVSIRSLTTGALMDNPILRTFTVAAAKNTTMSQIGMFTPGDPLTIGPLRALPSANDSIGWGFLVVPNDSLHITWEILHIKR